MVSPLNHQPADFGRWFGSGLVTHSKRHTAVMFGFLLFPPSNRFKMHQRQLRHRCPAESLGAEHGRSEFALVTTIRIMMRFSIKKVQGQYILHCDNAGGRERPPRKMGFDETVFHALRSAGKRGMGTLCFLSSPMALHLGACVLLGRQPVVFRQPSQMDCFGFSLLGALWQFLDEILHVWFSTDWHSVEMHGSAIWRLVARLSWFYCPVSVGAGARSPDVPRHGDGFVFLRAAGAMASVVGNTLSRVLRSAAYAFGFQGWPASLSPAWGCGRLRTHGYKAFRDVIVRNAVEIGRGEGSVGREWSWHTSNPPQLTWHC